MLLAVLAKAPLPYWQGTRGNLITFLFGIGGGIATG
jgi:hypothetical protein